MSFRIHAERKYHDRELCGKKLYEMIGPTIDGRTTTIGMVSVVSQTGTPNLEP